MLVNYLLENCKLLSNLKYHPFSLTKIFLLEFLTFVFKLVYYILKSVFDLQF